jgi:hypothetical protein
VKLRWWGMAINKCYVTKLNLELVGNEINYEVNYFGLE